MLWIWRSRQNARDNTRSLTIVRHWILIIKTILYVVGFGTAHRSSQSLRLCTGSFQSLHLSRVHRYSTTGCYYSSRLGNGIKATQKYEKRLDLVCIMYFGKCSMTYVVRNTLYVVLNLLYGWIALHLDFRRAGGLAISGHIGFAYPTFALWNTSDVWEPSFLSYDNEQGDLKLDETMYSCHE